MSPFYDPDDVDLEEDELEEDEEEDELEEDEEGPDPDFLDDDEEALVDGPRCVGCGCSKYDPCEGGCVWASEDLCSRCV